MGAAAGAGASSSVVVVAAAGAASFSSSGAGVSAVVEGGITVASWGMSEPVAALSCGRVRCCLLGSAGVGEGERLVRDRSASDMIVVVDGKRESQEGGSSWVQLSSIARSFAAES